MKKHTIITNNIDAYKKFNELILKKNISIHKGRYNQVQRIINKINKNDNILSVQKKKSILHITKIKPFNANIYFKAT